MLARICQSTISHSLGRRCIVRAESRGEAAYDDPREAVGKVPVIKRRRNSGNRLKKSKRMQALAASLASKTREGQSTEAASIQLPEPVVRPTEETQNDGRSKEAAKKFENAVHIPYEPKTKGLAFENDPEDLCVLPKPIYIVSDCTGDSAARTVTAALGQFESSIQAHCPATLLLHRFVSDKDRICKVIEDASKENALVVFTLVDPELVDVLQTNCAKHDVRCVDLWSNLLNIMEQHLDAIRSGLPMNHPNRLGRRLDPEYFRRIEAVEYTRKMDDGAHPERWHQADILLLGVSRSGKTPLSIYLGQRGYKVANLPLVKDLPIPQELYEIDQSKIFCLTIDPQYLFKIRRSRIGKLGVKKGRSMYADLKGVVEELDFAHSIYKHNPMWPVLDVTHAGVEESGTMIQRILSERYGLQERVIYA